MMENCVVPICYIVDLEITHSEVMNNRDTKKRKIQTKIKNIQPN